MKQRLSLLAVFAALLAPACVVTIDGDEADVDTLWSYDRPRLSGSGVSATQTREVAEFRSVSVNGSGAVRVKLGEAQSLRVITDDNLIEHVRTRVEDGALVVDWDRGSYSPKVALVVELSAPSLEAVGLGGSGDLTFTGLDAERFGASIAGSGSVRGSGKCGRLNLSIAGSGDLRVYDVVAREVEVSIAGSGSAYVHAHDKLDVSISGSGDVRYRGKPAISRSIAGSGSVRPE
jgi:hypothetical protein